MHSFEQIAGNGRLIDSLQSFIKTDKIPHAVIFSGEKGIGKKLIAKTFAKTLLCEAGSITPCNTCLSCRTFESNNNSDVIYVSASKSKSIGVDDIRDQIGRNVYIKPYSSAYKIFIIDNADTMTIPAQNSILKALEDSPLYAVFLLLAKNSGLLLPTVLSRCVLYKLNRLPVQLLRDFLIQNGISRENIDLLCIFSEGNIGRALSLVSDTEFIEMRNFVIDIAVNISNYDLIKILLLSKEFEVYKDRIQEALDVFLLWYRDLLVAKTASGEYLFETDLRSEITRTSEKYSVRELCDKIDAVWAAKDRLRHYANFMMSIEVLLMKLGAYDPTLKLTQ